MANPGRTARKTRRGRALILSLAGAAAALLLVPLPARSPGPTRFEIPAMAGMVRIAPGAHYQAGPVRRFLLGARYRDLWTEPVQVPVLRIERFEGGLVPFREGGGQQTRTLHFRSADGRQFVFRSTDKSLRLLPFPLRLSAVGRVLQDQISASHPGAPLVAVTLERAIGIAATPPRLVVLADSPGLGPWRPRFGGLLGVIRGEAPDSATLAELSTAHVLARLDSFPGERIDAGALLAARLVDFLLNDWDRHPGQWHWAPSERSTGTVWQPIPVDRDQALTWYDGALPDVIRLVQPKLVRFGPAFPSLRALTTNSRALDRLLLPVTRPQWDSITRVVLGRLNDSVLAAAVREMPPEWQKRSGALILTAFQQRRAELAALSEEFYRLVH